MPGLKEAKKAAESRGQESKIEAKNKGEVLPNNAPTRKTEGARKAAESRFNGRSFLNEGRGKSEASPKDEQKVDEVGLQRSSQKRM